MKRITMAEIKAHEWFLEDYVPALPYDNDDEDSELYIAHQVKEVHTYGQTAWRVGVCMS